VKRVVAMGGSYSRGNITPAAEFNVYADPEAADVLFRADWVVTMVGLDLTHQALANPELQKRVRAVGGTRLSVSPTRKHNPRLEADRQRRGV
jgi:purine nucleosidase